MMMQFDSRDELSNFVKLPLSPTICEIGTLRGEFAKQLYEMYNPKELILIDPWTGQVCSGNKDGNDVYNYDCEDNYRVVGEMFANMPSTTTVKMIRDFSQNVVIPSSSVDLIYIDGDHSYTGVACDLKLAFAWVKPGGWICGHDYEMNPQKTNNVYDFGVKRAVDEFCANTGNRIAALFKDGCVSYAIQKQKVL